MFFNLLVVFINTNDIEEVQAEETRKEAEAALEIETPLPRTEETGLLDQHVQATKQSRSLSINIEDTDTSDYDRVIAILAAKPPSTHPVTCTLLIGTCSKLTIQSRTSGQPVAFPSFNLEGTSPSLLSTQLTI